MPRPQVADDLADRMHLKLEATGPRCPFRLDVVAEFGEHHVFQVLEIAASDSLARRDGHLPR